MAARKKASSRVGAYKKQGGKKTSGSALTPKQRKRVVKKHSDLRDYFSW